MVGIGIIEPINAAIDAARMATDIIDIGSARGG
jgi:hypothetical protein